MQVFATADFEKECRKRLSKSQRRKLDNFIERFKRGDQRPKMLGPKWLSEVKLEGKLAYLVHVEDSALLVAISDKKDQQTVMT